MERKENAVELVGTVAGRPVESHRGQQEIFYRFPLEISRLSGTVDCLPILCEKALLEKTELNEGDHLLVRGELRSYNNKSGVGNRLVLSVLAKEMLFCTGEDRNSVLLSGVLCRRPTFRTTPMGREICDMMVAVNRRYGRSDYLPCIAWGRMAEEASFWEAGTGITLAGRFQSRKYRKLLDGEETERTAYEVSVSQLALTEELQPS